VRYLFRVFLILKKVYLVQCVFGGDGSIST
jgi:hypothetical protein